MSSFLINFRRYLLHTAYMFDPMLGTVTIFKAHGHLYREEKVFYIHKYLITMGGIICSKT